MFNSRAEAERVVDHLVSQLGLSRSAIRLDAGAGSTTTAGSAPPTERKGLLASLADLFLPDTDRHTYAGGMRRGGVLLSRPPCQPTLRRAARASSARRRASSSISGQGHAGWAAKTRSIQSAKSFRSSGTMRITFGSKGLRDVRKGGTFYGFDGCQRDAGIVPAVGV